MNEIDSDFLDKNKICY